METQRNGAQKDDTENKTRKREEQKQRQSNKIKTKQNKNNKTVKRVINTGYATFFAL